MQATTILGVILELYNKQTAHENKLYKQLF